ncbi:MAG: response regulator transcription factor, partial [Pseudomonadota bacterium]
AYLESAGHDVVERRDGLAGSKAALTDTFDLCIFDIMLPHRSGTQIAEAMRAQGSSTPVLFLTALGSEANVLQGFAAGADDYVIKPFSPRELVVRIRAILRRNQALNACGGDVVEAGPLKLDCDQPTCSLFGQAIALTPYEHKILRRLLEQPSRVLSRGQLIALLYGNDAAVGPKAIDVHVHNLRTKLGDETGAMIETVRGFGYRFSAPRGLERMIP